MSEEPAPKRLKRTNALKCTVITRSSHLRRVMNQVPDEIWLQILSHLNIVDISMVGATCARLHILAQDLSLWEKLKFDVANMRQDLGALESVIDRAVNVKEMNFTNVRGKPFDSMGIVSLIVRARKTLKVLTVTSAIKLENVAVARFGCLVKLEVLNLVLKRIDSTGVKAIAKLDNLIDLRISTVNYSLSDIDLKYLFKELRNLKAVVLDCSSITKNTFKTLAQNNPTLKTVGIRSQFCNRNASQHPSLADLTENCPDLSELYFSGWGGICNDDISALGQVKKLLRLDLSWCHSMTDDMVLNISKNCRQLRCLALCGLIVDFESIKALAQNCPNLKYVEIGGCNTGEIVEKVDFMYKHVEIAIDNIRQF